MNKSIGLVICSFLLLCSSLVLTGCSLIGYAIGDSADPAGPAEPIHVPEALSSFPTNTDVVIRKKDGTEIKGVFLRTGQVDEATTVEQYGRVFEQWRLRSGLKSSGEIPPFGTSIRIRVNVSRRHEIHAGRFAGFDPGMIRIHSSNQGRILPLRLEYVEGMDDSLGQVIATREEIAGVLNDGVPFASRPGVFLEREPGIPLDQIEAMERPVGGRGRWVGLAVGIAVDVAVLALVVSKSNIEAGPGGVDWNWGK